MNENINLVEILKDCPQGTKFYSPMFGEVTFGYIDEDCSYPIKLITKDGFMYSVSAKGEYYVSYGGECTLFPSKEQRDWDKFTAPWYKKEKFDPKTLKSFDRVLVRDCFRDKWNCSIFSHIEPEHVFPYACIYLKWKYCIPYNDDTKHLVGTKGKAPEYYRYWED